MSERGDDQDTFAAERDDDLDTRPSGMTIREEERRIEALRRGDPDPDDENLSGEGTVSERNEHETVVGGHGHGGALDLEIEQIESDRNR
jgi:hypothetical protein